LELWRELSKDGSLDANHGQVSGHAVTPQDALGATASETAGACDVAGGLLSCDVVGDCEGVEDVHGLGWVGLGD